MEVYSSNIIGNLCTAATESKLTSGFICQYTFRQEKAVLDVFKTAKSKRFSANALILQHNYAFF